MHDRSAPTRTRRRLILVPALAAIAAVLFVACGRSSISDGRGPGDGDDVRVVTVEVGDNFFDSDSVTVAPGDTVRWEWVGDQPHNVKSPEFASDLQTGGTFEHRFTSAGRHHYICVVHPDMTGTVEVLDR